MSNFVIQTIFPIFAEIIQQNYYQLNTIKDEKEF